MLCSGMQESQETMKELDSAGAIALIYTVNENSDKVEGRGNNIRTMHFFSKELAESWAKGRGAMGSNEHISNSRVVMAKDGRWYHLGRKFEGRVSDDQRVLEILEKLTDEERETLKRFLG